MNGHGQDMEGKHMPLLLKSDQWAMLSIIFKTTQIELHKINRINTIKYSKYSIKHSNMYRLQQKCMRNIQTLCMHN